MASYMIPQAPVPRGISFVMFGLVGRGEGGVEEGGVVGVERSCGD